MGVAAGATAIAPSIASANELNASGEVEAEIEEASGAKRKSLVKAARESEQVQFVVDQLGSAPSVKTAGEYTLNDDDGASHGKVVVLENEKRELTIKYYKSADFGGATAKVIGEKKVGDGVRKVDAEHKSVVDIGQTPKVKRTGREMVVEVLSNGGVKSAVDDPTDRKKVVRALKRVLVGSSEETPNPLLVQMPEKDANRAWLRIPLTQENDKPLFVNVEGTINSGKNLSLSITKGQSQGVFSYGSPNRVGVQNHIQCGGFYCVDACKVFCGTLAGATGVSCSSLCAASAVATSLTVGCGVFCSALTAALCYPTCKRYSGH